MGLICRNISFRYPDDAPVLSGLTYVMETPGFNALFGPSGVGKTTLARIIAGHINGFSGNVEVSGILRIAYSYNLERLPGWSAVGHHLERVVPESRRDLMGDLVSVFGLSDILGSRFSRLSLGQKNRVNLLRYLLQDFHLLILDESLANVDELTREKIILKIKDTFPGVYFLYISHNVAEVSRFCKDILVFRGSHREPRTRIVQGIDQKTGQAADRRETDRVMLEIMNAV